MGKAGKERKRRRLLAEVTAADVGAYRKADQENNMEDTDSSGLPHTKTFGGVVSEEDMATTLKTLLALEQHVDVFRSKACKALRAVVHQLQHTATATTGMGTQSEP